VSEVENANTPCSAANDDGENSTKLTMMSDLLTKMGHEIKTPMTAILGISKILLQDKTIPETVRDSINEIHISGELLHIIINDILDSAKIEVGKLQILSDEYETAILIGDITRFIMNLMRNSKVKFNLCLDENLPKRLCGDEFRIRQIVTNLLSCTLKNTSKGEIALSFSVRNDEEASEDNLSLIISVGSTGFEITEKSSDNSSAQSSGFHDEVFNAIDEPSFDKRFTRNIVELMGGEITAERESGKGTSCIVRLPQKRVGSEVLDKDTIKKLQDFRVGEAKNVQQANAAPESMPYGSVLVVDDVRSNIFVAKGLLLSYKLSVDTAVSGFEAIDKITNGNVYDIIFMDYKMPKMDGVEATSIIRALGYKNPIIALTANDFDGQHEMFLSNGFDDVILKPIDTNLLDTLLKKYIRDKYKQT